MLAEPPAVVPEQIVSWARNAVASQPRFGWYAHVLAMAYLRAGNYDAAKESVELSRTLGWNVGGQALNDLVSAMIDRVQGRAASAMEQFERSERPIFDRNTGAHVDGTPMLTDWLEFQILRRQIEGPLLDAVFPADPFAR